MLDAVNFNPALVIVNTIENPVFAPCEPAIPAPSGPTA